MISLDGRRLSRRLAHIRPTLRRVPLMDFNYLENSVYKIGLCTLPLICADDRNEERKNFS